MNDQDRQRLLDLLSRIALTRDKREIVVDGRERRREVLSIYSLDEKKPLENQVDWEAIRCLYHLYFKNP